MIGVNQYLKKPFFFPLYWDQLGSAVAVATRLVCFIKCIAYKWAGVSYGGFGAAVACSLANTSLTVRVFTYCLPVFQILAVLEG